MSIWSCGRFAHDGRAKVEHPHCSILVANGVKVNGVASNRLVQAKPFREVGYIESLNLGNSGSLMCHL